nr:hypothetical protein [Halorubrum sp. GN11_10-6_MGM]
MSMDSDESASDARDGNSGVEVGGGAPDNSEPDVLEEGAIEGRLGRFLRSGRTNALVAWAMVTVLAGVFVESLFDFDLLPMAIVAAMIVVVLAPAISARNAKVMLPWEVLGLALLPVLVRALFGGEVGTFAAYLALAAFALIITVELHMFTTLRVTHWFAVVFVVMTTLATAAVLTVLRWNADRMLGTNLLTTNKALMIEWLYVTLAGLVAGVLFDAYFRRREAYLHRAIGWVVRR